MRPPSVLSSTYHRIWTTSFLHLSGCSSPLIISESQGVSIEEC
jgi:hypothetical protein